MWWPYLKVSLLKWPSSYPMTRSINQGRKSLLIVLTLDPKVVCSCLSIFFHHRCQPLCNSCESNDFDAQRRQIGQKNTRHDLKSLLSCNQLSEFSPHETNPSSSIKCSQAKSRTWYAFECVLPHIIRNCVSTLSSIFATIEYC